VVIVTHCRRAPTAFVFSARITSERVHDRRSGAWATRGIRPTIEHALSSDMFAPRDICSTGAATSRVCCVRQICDSKEALAYNLMFDQELI
jgi:hypothetical protein